MQLMICSDEKVMNLNHFLRQAQSNVTDDLDSYQQILCQSFKFKIDVWLEDSSPLATWRINRAYAYFISTFVIAVAVLNTFISIC